MQPVVTIGISAHANAGKTTITEQLLYHTKVIEKAGRVDHGDTVSDSMKVERERGISVRAALVSFHIAGKKIYLIDTPGHVDFSAEVERSLAVLDGAVMVVSGVDGVQAQTCTIWRALRKRDVPTVVFVNKMDRVGADYDRTVAEIAANLDARVLPLVKVVNRGGGRLAYSEIPHAELLDAIAEYDDEFLEDYLNGREIAPQLVRAKIEHLARQAKLFPVIGGSALNDSGVEELIACIDRFFPCAGGDAADPFSALVYSIRMNNNLYSMYLSCF